LISRVALAVLLQLQTQFPIAAPTQHQQQIDPAFQLQAVIVLGPRLAVVLVVLVALAPSGMRRGRIKSTASFAPRLVVAVEMPVVLPCLH
jgi:hypothetical protein